jgi:hypothetical protein
MMAGVMVATVVCTTLMLVGAIGPGPAFLLMLAVNVAWLWWMRGKG